MFVGYDDVVEHVGKWLARTATSLQQKGVGRYASSSSPQTCVYLSLSAAKVKLVVGRDGACRLSSHEDARPIVS